MPCQVGCVEVVKAKLIVPAAAVMFDPPGGEYTGTQLVALSSVTPGAVIHYTTDGSTPTADSPVYTGPITVDRNTTLQAIAIAPGAPASVVSYSAYAVTPPPPPPPPQIEKLELKATVVFATGTATIAKTSYQPLDEVAAALKDHPDVKSVEIQGHTDDRGGAKANLKLSQRRAEAVRKYLVSRGIAPGRLTAKGYGETRPIASNKTAEGRKANRRVDFVVTQQGAAGENRS
jgi:outer membrane protein OmpA-like peptidoglycan-associated protein